MRDINWWWQVIKISTRRTYPSRIHRWSIHTAPQGYEHLTLSAEYQNTHFKRSRKKKKKFKTISNYFFKFFNLNYFFNLKLHYCFRRWIIKHYQFNLALKKFKTRKKILSNDDLSHSIQFFQSSHEHGHSWIVSRLTTLLSSDIDCATGAEAAKKNANHTHNNFWDS